jgi:hypothetical protein
MFLELLPFLTVVVYLITLAVVLATWFFITAYCLREIVENLDK